MKKNFVTLYRNCNSKWEQKCFYSLHTVVIIATVLIYIFVQKWKHGSIKLKMYSSLKGSNGVVRKKKHPLTEMSKTSSFAFLLSSRRERKKKWPNCSSGHPIRRPFSWCTTAVTTALSKRHAQIRELKRRKRAFSKESESFFKWWTCFRLRISWGRGKGFIHYYV